MRRVRVDYLTQSPAGPRAPTSQSSRKAERRIDEITTDTNLRDCKCPWIRSRMASLVSWEFYFVMKFNMIPYCFKSYKYDVLKIS